MSELPEWDTLDGDEQRALVETRGTRSPSERVSSPPRRSGTPSRTSSVRTSPRCASTWTLSSSRGGSTQSARTPAGSPRPAPASRSTWPCSWSPYRPVGAPWEPSRTPEGDLGVPTPDGVWVDVGTFSAHTPRLGSFLSVQENKRRHYLPLLGVRRSNRSSHWFPDSPHFSGYRARTVCFKFDQLAGSRILIKSLTPVCEYNTRTRPTSTITPIGATIGPDPLGTVLDGDGAVLGLHRFSPRTRSESGSERAPRHRAGVPRATFPRVHP